MGGLSRPRCKVEAAVLPDITTKLPALPVSFNRNLRHLSGLLRADPEFGVPGNMDVLSGADAFSRVVRQGQRRGPPGSPTALETCLGWVMSGTVKHNSLCYQEVSCMSTVLAGNEIFPN